MTRAEWWWADWEEAGASGPQQRALRGMKKIAAEDHSRVAWKKGSLQEEQKEGSRETHSLQEPLLLHHVC